MGIFNKKIEKRGADISIGQLDDMLDLAIMAQAEWTRKAVTIEDTLGISAVFCAIQVISQAVASLPFNLYIRNGRNKERADGYYLQELLRYQPNPAMTAFNFWEYCMENLLLLGNFYALKGYSRGSAGLKWLYPLAADRVRVDVKSGEKWYYYRDNDGSETEYGPNAIFHVPGIGFDGVTGVSVIKLARESFGLSIATEEHGARFFGNGATLSGVLESDKQISMDAKKRLVDSWHKTYGGVGNSGKVALLEEGMKYKTISIPPEDAQFLGTREFQVSEVARWFNIPPHKLKDLKRATFSNIEQQQIEFVQDTVRPWLVRIEQAVRKDLFNDKEKARMLGEFNADALLRGDMQSRNTALEIQRRNGILSANEWRAIENMNEIEHEYGSKYYVPLNWVDAEKKPEVEENLLIEDKETLDTTDNIDREA